MPRRGWTKLPGSSERYLSPEGEEVSRRQYDNLRAEAEGWGSRSAYERRYEDPTYLWATKRLAQEQGKRASQIDRMGSEANKKLLKAKRTGWGKSKEGRSPRGPMAKLLVEMGMRDPSATYAVGDTDGRRK